MLFLMLLSSDLMDSNAVFTSAATDLSQLFRRLHTKTGICQKFTRVIEKRPNFKNEAENTDWMLSCTFQRVEIKLRRGSFSAVTRELDRPFIAVSSDQLTCDT